MRFCVSLALAALLLGTLPARAQLAVGGCDEDSLNQAISDAQAAGTNVVFTNDCGPITLSATINITSDTTIDTQGHSVTISGGGSTNGTGVEVFYVVPGVHLTLLGLTIASGQNTNGGGLYIDTNATVVLSNCTFTGNVALGTNGAAGANGNNGGNTGGSGSAGTSGTSGLGGAIYSLGQLTLQRCQLLGNTALGGAGGAGGNGGSGSTTGGNGGSGGNGANAYGGAIYNRGTLWLTDCTFAGNTVTGGAGGAGGTNGSGQFPSFVGDGGAGGAAFGAGIYSPGFSTVLNCTFSTNAATGAAPAAGGTSSSSKNGVNGKTGGAGLGGGICSLGTNSLVNCTFAGNTATGGTGGDGGPSGSVGGNGGAGGTGSGGGFYSSSTTHVTNCTFLLCGALGGTGGNGGSAPFPGSSGGAGASNGGDLANAGATFILRGSILSTNLSGGNGFGTITDAGYNISSDASITLSGTSHAGTDPRIGSLAANGGPTMTTALTSSNSPAYNKIPTNFPATDQRGAPRPGAGKRAADIGAYEVGPPFVQAIQTQPQGVQQPDGSVFVAQTNGGTVTFSAVVVGDLPIRYRWRFYGTNIPGSTATNSTYTVSNVSITNAGPYSVRVTNAFGVATSAVAVLSVAYAPSITTQPADQAGLAGTNATFTVTATGDPPLFYQWYFNETNTIGGATSSSFTVFNAQAANAGAYSVVITNASGVVTSDLATLTVGTLPSIVTQPADQTVDPNTTVTISVTAAGTAPLMYTWFFNSTNLLTGVSGPSYTFTAVASKAGGYLIRVGNDFGSIDSDTAILTVGIPRFTISGRVLDGSNGLGGVTVAGADTNSAVTDSSGNYVITNVVASGAGGYSIFAERSGYQFSPPQTVVVGPDASNVNFTVTARLHSISGRVHYGTNGLSGVTFREFPSVTTDVTGAYTLSGQVADTYTLTPSLNGYHFNPTNRVVLVTTQDVSGVDFIAGTLITSIVRQSSGAVRLALSAPAGQANRIEASTNLIAWVGLVTNTGSYQFTDTNAVRFPYRFYRAARQ